MIKKITTCFLVMAIVAGCTQAPVEADKPEEPPVVEQPQKPMEQEKPKEETNEPKEKLIVTRPSETTILDDGFVTVTSYLINLKIDSFNGWDEMDISKKVDMIQFDINSEDVLIFNQYMQDETDKWLSETTYFEDGENKDHWHTTAMKDIKYFIYEDVIAVVSKINRYLYVAGSANTIYEVSNFEISTGRKMSNLAILSKMNIDANSLQNQLLNKIQIDNIPCSELKENELSYCYEDRNQAGSYFINDDTQLFFDNEGNCNVIVDIRNAMKEPKEIFTIKM